MSAVDRTMPPAMARLTRMALEAGLDEVEIGFEGLGSDFPAPIGWQLSLSRLDPMLVDGDDTNNLLTVGAQIGSDATAYVGPYDAEDPYLNADQIAAWIGEPRDGVSEYTAEEKAQFVRDADLFLSAIANGWGASREFRRHEAQVLTKHLSDGEPRPMIVSTKFSALNWFFNTEGHPAHRDNGTAVSEYVFLSKSGVTGDHFYCSVSGKKIEVAEGLARVAAKASWFAPVALFDEDTEEWVL